MGSVALECLQVPRLLHSPSALHLQHGDLLALCDSLAARAPAIRFTSTVFKGRKEGMPGWHDFPYEPFFFCMRESSCPEAPQQIPSCAW